MLAFAVFLLAVGEEELAILVLIVRIPRCGSA